MPEQVNTVDGLVATEIQLRLLILGSYSTLAELQTAHATGEQGDAYMVGENCYIWDVATSAWVNIGTFKGPVTYTHVKYSAVATPGDADITDTPSTYLGIYTGTASTAPTTAISYRWVKIVGEDGAVGPALVIKGYYATSAALLAGETTPTAGDAYVVGETFPYSFYMYSGSEWINAGPLSAVNDALVGYAGFMLYAYSHIGGAF